MQYAISGNLGFIGQNLKHKMAEDHSHSHALSLDKLSGHDLTESPIIAPPCKHFIHLASETDVRQSIKEPEEHIINNLWMFLNCINYAKDSNADFTFTSSMGAPDSLSPYSASKLACESICKAYHESYGLKTKILRLSNVYGPYSLHKTSVVAKFIKACLDKNSLTIIGDGLQTRDFIHVDDVVNTILNPSDAKIVNVASGKDITVIHLARMITNLSDELTQFRPDIYFEDPINGEINNIELNTDIKSAINLKSGLRSTFKWFMENYKC